MGRYSDPVEVLSVAAGRQSLPVVLLCEHAGRRCPPHLGHLGLAPEIFDRHIAYDIGIEGVVRHLHQLLDVPVVMCHYSRLIVDCDRHPDYPRFMSRIEDTTVIPANQQVGPDDLAERMASVYYPYHRAADEMVEAVRVALGRVLVINMHSFTPQRLDDGIYRPWHLALSTYAHDDRPMHHLADIIERGGISVGRHQPFDKRGEHDGEHAHCDACDQILFEIRNDLIADAAGQAAWAARVAPFISALARDFMTVDGDWSRVRPVGL